MTPPSTFDLIRVSAPLVAGVLFAAGLAIGIVLWWRYAEYRAVVVQFPTDIDAVQPPKERR